MSGNSGGASSGSQGGKVPFTGAELALMVSLGLALLGAGSVTVLAGRRRRVP